MKIGIYDKWLVSLGGGERVATVMAETLVKAGHKVDLISSFEVDKKEVERKMGVDLSKVNMVAWYTRSVSDLTLKTKKYDVFINVSFMDHLPSEARYSIYYVHFPTPLKTTFLGFVKYEKVLPFLRKFLIIPDIQSGINPVDEIYARSGRWLGKSNTIVFSNTPKEFSLTLRLYIEQLNLESLETIKFYSHDSEVKITDKYIDHNFNVGVFKLMVKNKGSAILKIEISEDTNTNGFALVSMAVKNVRFLFWNFLKRYLPKYEMALYGSSTFKVAKGLSSYDLFLANSEYTKRWTKKYWDKNANILYPPIDTKNFIPGKKKNIILNIGRFFVGGHSKKQEVLITAFKKMFDQNRIDNSWELHFVGGVSGVKEHSDYLKQLQKSAEGYKIYFHLSMPFKSLTRLCSSAKIYWHATGYGEDKNASPISFEHFGITVIEAMSAGAVPVVFNGGGLTETVNSECGLVWNTISDLQTKTVQLINNESLLKKLSVNAIERSKFFSRSKFEEEFLKYVKG